jgi:hypothetical protein
LLRSTEFCKTFLDSRVLHPKSGTSQLLLTESQNFLPNS